MSAAKTPRMKHRLLLAISLVLTLLSLSTQAYANHEGQDGQPRNSWEQQQETYRKHNYDTYRNGPLPETREQERRQERQRQDNRQDQRRETQRDSGGYFGGERCQTSYERC